MNDEIKEILDEFMNFDFNSQGERIEINEYERNILKDYITNLQQENKDNNWNELKKWLEIKEEKETIGTFSDVLDKIKELENE